ncbi:MAG: putative capsular polysaccharide synthesis family protein [Actinomycetota bacterium]
MTRRETRRAMAARPIVVFSMGKTGTTSLTAALERATGRPVVKAHALSDDGIERRLAKAGNLAINARPRFLWECEAIAEVVAGGGDWQILCGVRDPIALAVSDHFYGLQRQAEVGVDPWLGADADTGRHRAAIEENLVANFVERDWFADELRAVTGIDAYATPFPTDEGHLTVTNGRFTALITRAEDLSRVGPTAIAAFLDLPTPLDIDRRNVGDRAAGSARDRFLARGRLGPAVVDAAYETPMARHFYTDDERRELAARWTGALV